SPTLTSFTAEPVSLIEGTSTTLTVVASDADGDALTYAWSQASPAAPVGTFGTEEGASRTWTAPTLSSTTTYSLVVTVSDGRGGSIPATVDVEVVNDPTANLLPVVDETITVSSATALAGDTLELSIGASDPDGDTLTYAWTTSPAAAGSFTDATAATTQWSAPEVAQASTYTLLVTVSDGSDSVTRSVDVQVSAPSYATHIQPIWDQACTSCHNNSSSGRGGLTLEAGNSYTSLVNANGSTNVCTSLKRVKPGAPDSSLLVQKLSGTTCGTRMPQNDTAWFDTHPGLLTRIRSWILAGAAND
ncbi:MAG TPA: PKD domain-containing protein, partial [Myxococcaceae bacterium]|nr:PKD domain-containing protein [Myxococcaceae bacterium]